MWYAKKFDFPNWKGTMYEANNSQRRRVLCERKRASRGEMTSDLNNLEMKNVTMKQMIAMSPLNLDK